jgi:transposase
VSAFPSGVTIAFLREEVAMDVLHERCAGLDVHQETVVCCVLISEPGGRCRKEFRTFGTMTVDLEALRDWLRERGVSHVAMESTGVFWKPVYAVLEGHVEIVVGNAQHIRNVPGRKTDIKDAEWLGQLLRHGLIRASFVPPPEFRELRELLRFRRGMVQDGVRLRNRMIRRLEGAGIKLAAVASDVFGVSGRAMLRALIDGTQSPAEMADLARRRMRGKLPALARALDGRLSDSDRFLLDLDLKQLERLEADLSVLDERIEEKLAPYREQRRQLMAIPGVDAVAAATILAEVGIDMAVFGTAKRLAAWAGVCPGNRESAGKTKAAATRKGNPHLKAALFTAAASAVRKKGSYYKAKYYRLKARQGAKRALMAIAHKILVAVFQMLSRNESFQDLGEAYLDRLAEKRVTFRLIERLNALGYDVELRPKAAA